MWYINAFGNWNPDQELAQLFSGMIGDPRRVETQFTFTAPSQPGHYCIRIMARGWFYPIWSFYGGAADDPQASPSCWQERHFFVASTGVKENKNSPHLEVMQNSPNPFLSYTKIEFSIPERASVSLKIFNSTGQLVRTLVNQEMDPGTYIFGWDGKSDSGKRVPPGSYFCILKIDGKTTCKKMVVLK